MAGRNGIDQVREALEDLHEAPFDEEIDDGEGGGFGPMRALSLIHI